MMKQKMAAIHWSKVKCTYSLGIKCKYQYIFRNHPAVVSTNLFAFLSTFIKNF